MGRLVDVREKFYNSYGQNIILSNWKRLNIKYENGFHNSKSTCIPMRDRMWILIKIIPARYFAYDHKRRIW